MHIILTGERNVGKTTLAWRLGKELRSLGFCTCGFVTEQTPDGLFLHNLAGGEPVAIAYTARPSSEVAYTMVGRYYFLTDSLRLAGHMLRWPCDVMIVDEIGRWEAMGGGLTRALDLINHQATHSITVVRKSALSLIKAKYHREPMVIEVTPSNRDQVLHAILCRFQQFDDPQQISRIN